MKGAFCFTYSYIEGTFCFTGRQNAQLLGKVYFIWVFPSLSMLYHFRFGCPQIQHRHQPIWTVIVIL